MSVPLRHCALDRDAVVNGLLPLAVVVVLWGAMFRFWSSAFWPTMTLTACGLATFSFLADHSAIHRCLRWRARWLLWGPVLAGVLYAVFWLANDAAARLFSFAPGEVSSIYDLRSGRNPWVVAALLLFLIGPSEEIFWRGHLQSWAERRLGNGARAWILVSLCYALVHSWSGNLMLVGAALTGGLFWGAVFALSRNLWPGIISHALWDVAILILRPIR